MKIEAGKYYRTWDGRKVGPMRDDWMDDKFRYHVRGGSLNGNLWDDQGRGYPGQDDYTDLISEWTECASPIPPSADWRNFQNEV